MARHLPAAGRLVLAMTFSLGAATMLAPVALGECSAFDRPPDRTLNVGYAFIATVVEASSAVDPPARGNAEYDWHVELRIERVVRGSAPRRLVFNGWGVGCHTFEGNHLHTGDRIFVAVEGLNLRFLPTEPMVGDTVVWRRVDHRWHYAERVVGTSEFPLDEFLTTSMRQADTTAELVAIVRSADLPDTATASTLTRAQEPAEQPVWTVLAAAALIGLLAWTGRPGARASSVR